MFELFKERNLEIVSNCNPRGVVLHKAGEQNPVMIIVPPGIVHGYKNISDKDAWCINVPDKLYRGEDRKETVDEIRWEEKSDSPYKIE